MLKIIGKDSSINVRKVLWTCLELDLPFERQDWNEAQGDLGALNPNRLVPVLVDEGLVLWESNTICRYLCNQHVQKGGGALLPRVRATAPASSSGWIGRPPT